MLLRIWEILNSYLLQIFKRVFVSCIFIWKILLRNAYDPICHGSNDINNIQVFLTRIILTQSCHHSSFFFMKLAHLVHLSELWQQHLTMKYKKCKTWSPTTMIILCTNYFVSSYSHFLHIFCTVGCMWVTPKSKMHDDFSRVEPNTIWSNEETRNNSVF